MRASFPALMLSILFAVPAVAKEERRTVPVDKVPIEQTEARTSEFSFDTYHSGIQVVRTRSPGKVYATFTADPYLIDAGAAIVFEVRSVAKTGSVLRWRCVARDDVAECLGAPVRVRYLPEDEKIVLTARLVPQSHLDLGKAMAAR